MSATLLLAEDSLTIQRIIDLTFASEGIRVIATPGHTVGHQSLVVATTRGDVVLAGQAVHAFQRV